MDSQSVMKQWLKASAGDPRLRVLGTGRNTLWCVPQLLCPEGGQHLSPDANGCCGSRTVQGSRIWPPFLPHPFQWQASLFSMTSVWGLSQTPWLECQVPHKHSKAETTVRREKGCLINCRWGTKGRNETSRLGWQSGWLEMSPD